MPVGAIVGSAVVGVGGAAMGASAQKSAAKKASATQQNTTNQNNQLTRDIYAQNQSALSPFMNTGLAASGAISELLGLSGPPQSAPATQGYQTPQTSALAPYSPFAANDVSDPTYGGRINPRVPLRLQQAGMDEWRAEQQAAQQPMQYQQPQAMAGQPAAQPTARSAFDNYRASTGYQFRLGEGQNAINSNYAARGLLESGAAQKALLRYGQDFGAGEFGNYLGALQGQQALGASSASALAGVSTNMGNTVTANNQAAGSALANSQLMGGAASQNMWAGIGNSVANAAGQMNMLGTSYGMRANPWGVRTPGGGGIY